MLSDHRLGKDLPAGPRRSEQCIRQDAGAHGRFLEKNGIWQLLLRNAFLTRYFSYCIRTGFEYLNDFVKTRDFQDFF